MRGALVGYIGIPLKSVLSGEGVIWQEYIKVTNPISKKVYSTNSSTKEKKRTFSVFVDQLH